MDVVVTSVNGTLKAGVLSESLLKTDDSHSALEEIKEWEKQYAEFITKCKELLLENKASDLSAKWLIGDLIHRFLTRYKNINFLDWDKSIARDADIYPTEKRKQGFGDNDVKTFVALRTIFHSVKVIDKRFSWELLYYTHPILINYMKKTKLTTISIPQTPIITGILRLANDEAKFAIKGNSGHAISVTKKIVESIIFSLEGA